jgi:tRNA(Ile)-lysidine synthase
MTDFTERVLETLEATGVLPPGATVVAAVSGGPDSMALLHALAQLAPARRWTVAAAHLHHGIRGADADADEDFVRREAAARGCRFAGGRRDVPAEAAAAGIGIEEAARTARYAFLQETAAACGAAAIATGHTADDNAETVLHRVLRGTGLHGLAGIPLVRRDPGGVPVVRPMLRLARAEVTAFLETESVPFREDRTNADTAFTRNRLRRELIPLLERDFNPRVREALLRLAAVAGELDIFEALARDRAAALLREDGPDAQVLDIPALLAEPAAVRSRVAALACGAERTAAYDHVRRVLALAADGVSGATLELPGGLRVTREHDRLRFHRDTPPPARPPVELALPGVTPLWEGAGAIEASLADGGPADLEAFRRTKGANEEMLDFDRVAPPLVVRTRRPGDRFHPLGAPGETKLKDVLIDARVPLSRRDTQLLVADARRILWVVGLRPAEPAKITPATRRLLRLTLRT